MLQGNSRAPWTTVRCSMRSLWAWTGATQDSPKRIGLFSTLGKFRAPRTTVRCSMRSLWAWTGATQDSPKRTGLFSTVGAPAPSPADITKTTMVTRREPPLRCPRMSYRALTPHSPAGGCFAPGKVPPPNTLSPGGSKSRTLRGEKSRDRGERLDGVPGSHPSPETVFRHRPLPDAGEGNDAGRSTTRVRRRGGRAGRRG